MDNDKNKFESERSPSQEAWEKHIQENGYEVIGGELHLAADHLERCLGHGSGIYEHGGIIVEISKRPKSNKKNLKMAVLLNLQKDILMLGVTSIMLNQLILMH